MPDTSTEVVIASQTLGSTAATINFTSIPATYTDLRVVISGIQSSNYLAPTMILNSDSGTNYSNTKIKGNGSAASSSRNTNSNRLGLGLYRSASVITTVTINNSGWGTDFAAGSVATLYGIL